MTTFAAYQKIPSAQLLIKEFTCPDCRGHGYFDVTEGENLLPLVAWGTPDIAQTGCKNCGGYFTQKGSGVVVKHFYISDSLCLYCSGTGSFTTEKIVEDIDRKGRNHRTTHATTHQCPACFGTKKKLHQIMLFPCTACEGVGTINVWEKAKGWWAKGEVEVEKKCPRCEGSGKETRIEQFAWEHEFKE